METKKWDRYRVVKYIGILLIVLGILLPIASWPTHSKSQTSDTPEETSEKVYKLYHAERMMKFGQILVLAGIGLIILTRRR